nr:VanW family protein [Tissierella sp.]
MRKWLLLFLAGVIVAGAVIVYKINEEVKKDTIYRGISIAGIDVSGKNTEEALQIIKEKQETQLAQKNIIVKGQDKEYTINLKELGFTYDYQEAVDEAYSFAREGNIFERYKEIKTIEAEKKEIELKSEYDKKKIDEKVKKIAGEINKEALDAEFDFNGGNIKITDEKNGYKVQEEALNSKIEDNIYKLELIDVPIEIIKPERTREYYSKINGVIGESTTRFSNSGPGRVNNIKLSARAFNGRIVHPGESISYNSTLGPVNTKSGYQDAPIIVAGDLTPGVGGGICQTSTTLYNALLRADLTVTERSHHSITSAYIDKVLDAVVAGYYLDLKFKNDFDYPIYISSGISGKSVTFKIYGDKENMNYTIQMQPQITKVIPHKVTEIVKKDLKPGERKLEQAGRDGYQVTTYKHKIRDGKIIETKKMSSDYYRERETIYHIGPEAVKPEPIPEPSQEETEELKPEATEPDKTEKVPAP